MSGKTIASLQAVIGADVSGFERGASQVRSTLGNLKNDMQKLGGSFPGDKLGADFQQYMAGMNKAIPVTRTFGQTASDAWAKYANFSQNMQKTLLTFAGSAAMVGVAGKAVYDFGKSGAELEYTRARFDRLAASMGTTGKVFMNELRVATKGTVSDMQLARNGADLFQLGLARTSEEAIRLSRVQTALGMDTGELTLALANQSKRRLDQLGLSLTKFNEIESKLKGQGMSKEDAFREAFMQTAEYTIATTGNKADSAAGDYARLEAGWANMLDAGKAKAAEKLAPTISGVSMFMQGMSSLMRGDTVWDMSGGLGADSYVRAAKAQDKSSLWANGGTQGVQRTTKDRYGNDYNYTAQEAITGLSATQNYTAMAFAYQQPGGGPQAEQAAAPAVDYERIFGASIAMTKANESYENSVQQITKAYDDNQYVRQLYKTDMADLKDQLRDGDISTKEYNESVQELTASYKDGSYAASKQRESIADLEAAQDEQGAGFVSSILEQDGVSKEMQYDYAVATGQITKQAADQAKALDKVAQAYASGAISAEDAAYATRAVTGDVQALNGLSAEAYVDVFITTHGSVPVGMTTADVTKESKRGGGLAGDKVFASGGTGIGAGLYSVGEMGEEGLRVNADGTVDVIPAGDWRSYKKWGGSVMGGFALGAAGMSVGNMKARLLSAAQSVRGGSVTMPTGTTTAATGNDIVTSGAAQTGEIVQKQESQASTAATQESNNYLSKILQTLQGQPTRADERANIKLQQTNINA